MSYKLQGSGLSITPDISYISGLNTNPLHQFTVHYQFLAFSKLRRRYIYFGTSLRDLFKTQVSNDSDFPLGKKSHDFIPSVYDHFYLLKISRRKKVLKRSEEVILQKKMSESMDLKDVPTCIHEPIVAEFGH